MIVRQFDVRKELGTAVRAFRTQLNLSQEALSERSELHRTYISDIERGTRNVSLENIARLAQALNVSIPELFSQPKLAASPMTGQTRSSKLTKY